MMAPEPRKADRVATMQPAVQFTCNDYQTTPADIRYEPLDGDITPTATPAAV